MKQISALFRVEVSHRIGMGHLVRSLALAEELARHDIESFFILGEAAAEHIKLVESKGFPAYKLRCASGKACSGIPVRLIRIFSSGHPSAIKRSLREIERAMTSGRNCSMA